jgi:hypothetical protein
METVLVRGSMLLYYPELFCTCSRFGAIFLDRILSNNKHKQYQNILYKSPVLGQIYAPLYYPELTTPRRENWKIQQLNEILKANDPTLYVQKLQIYRMTLKTYYEIIFLLHFRCHAELFVKISCNWRHTKWHNVLSTKSLNVSELSYRK